MGLELKYNYSRLKMFLLVAVLVGITLCVLQIYGTFFKLDALLLHFPEGVTYHKLPVWVLVFIVMFHTMLPGMFILEEGMVKGIIYTVIGWFFYGVLIHSYSSTFQLYIPLVAPLLGCVISIIRVLAWEYSFIHQEKEGLKKTFDSYVEPDVVDILLSNPDMVNQDGVRKTVTIMFADLRGFTNLCEIMPPEQVITMLRDCFGQLISIARSHNGTVDKLIGDSVMVVWGDPYSVDNHAEKAVEAAMEMQAVMRELQKKWLQRRGVEILLGIGINTDEGVAGTIGSEEFSDYTVLGCGVNLASRLESVCPGGQICISKHTMDLLKGRFTCKKLGELKQKNKTENVEVYRVVQ